MQPRDMLTKIRDVYGLDVADLASANLLAIFRRLYDQRADERSSSGRTQ